jgi:dipeptidyl aminopeptidase/acylaminoacyl peptidase
VVLGALVFGRFRIWQSSALKSVQNTRIPILLIHGEDDRLVPCSMSFEIAAASPSPVIVHTFPNAGHGLSYMVDPLRYERIVYEFLLPITGVGDKISESFRNQISQ